MVQWTRHMVAGRLGWMDVRYKGWKRLGKKTVENDRKNSYIVFVFIFFGWDENENQRSKYKIGIVGYSKTIEKDKL
jgi:hypothetical protein